MYMTLYNSVVGEFSVMSTIIIIIDNMFIIILFIWYSCTHAIPILHYYSVYDRNSMCASCNYCSLYIANKNINFSASIIVIFVYTI